MTRTAKALIWGMALLMLAGLAAASGAVAAGNPKSPAPASPAPHDYDEEAEAAAPRPGPRGALDIRCQSEEGRTSPPVEMVLTNPAGETVGYDPRYQSTYREIPGGSYKREVVPGFPEIEAEVIQVRNAGAGTYSLRVIGVETGAYSLFLKGYDRDGTHADVQFTRARIKPGYIHHYRINYSLRGGPGLEVKRTLITE